MAIEIKMNRMAQNGEELLYRPKAETNKKKCLNRNLISHEFIGIANPYILIWE